MAKKNNVVSFDVRQSDIVNKIEILDGVTSSRTVDPVLQCVLFKVESGFMDKEPKVELISTNLQTTITTSVNVSELEHSGGDVKFLVMSDLLHDIVKSFDEDDVLTFTYNVDDGKLVIKSGKSKYTLTTYSEVEKFPDVETLIDETDSVITVETSILEELIDKVIFCTSTDNNLRNLNSILWTTNENGELVLVGTDGYRLGLASSEIQTSNNQPVQFLIDLKTMKEIYKLVTTTTEPELKIYVYNSSVVMFDTGDIKIITRTVEDRFPDYTRIININTNTTVTVNTDELKEVLKRTSVLSNKSGEKLMLEVTDSVVRFVVRSSDFGEVVDELDIIDKQGNDLIISFNPKLLNEIIKHIDTSKCEFKFVDNVSPVKILPVESEFTYFYILMPIRM
jgi:DNA polymerase-3 subunit beta